MTVVKRLNGKLPAEPVYDVDATAYRRFFELPDDEWKWRFDFPKFGLRIVALDLNHIADIGTTYQTCHPLDEASDQFRWYKKLLDDPQPFVVTIHNTSNGAIRHKKGWHEMLSQGTCCITGYGYFAERAEVDGFSYYNTALNGKGDPYPDRHSSYFVQEDNYILMTVPRDGKMFVEIKNLDTGKVLDRKEYEPKRPTAMAEEKQLQEPSSKASSNTLSQADQTAGWKLLFDGHASNGWRAFQGDAFPAEWKVADGMLVCTARSKEQSKSRSDLVTVEEFDNFHLQLDWKIEPGGNGGVFVRVGEDVDKVWHAGPEIQLADDAAMQHVEKHRRNAACYGLYAAEPDAARPPGKWNQLSVIAERNFASGRLKAAFRKGLYFPRNFPICTSTNGMIEWPHPATRWFDTPTTL